MPEPNRIGVIAPLHAYDEWCVVAGVPRTAAWCIKALMDTTVMSQNNWLLTGLLCLPGWEELDDAQAIRAAAEALVVPSPRRGRDVAPTEDPLNAALERGAALVRGEEISGTPLTRAECVAYLRDRFPHAIDPQALDLAEAPDLIMLRGLSIRAEAARLNNQEGMQDLMYRHQMTALIGRLNESARAISPHIVSVPLPAPTAEQRRRAPPPPVADVLADAMTRARESVAQGNIARRARQTAFQRLANPNDEDDL